MVIFNVSFGNAIEWCQQSHWEYIWYQHRYILACTWRWEECFLLDIHIQFLDATTIFFLNTVLFSVSSAVWAAAYFFFPLPEAASICLPRRIFLYHIKQLDRDWIPLMHTWTFCAPQLLFPFEFGMNRLFRRFCYPRSGRHTQEACHLIGTAFGFCKL